MPGLARSLQRLPRVVLVLLLAGTLSACLGDDDSADTAPVVDESPQSPLQPSAPGGEPEPTPAPAVNHPPEILGTPPLSAKVGEPYSFIPEASDEDQNDFLEFSIENLPQWAQFDAETGELTGTPGDADVGETDDITITVTDGRDSRGIGPFRIVITPRDQEPPPGNSAPTIEGVPESAVFVGQPYVFQPIALDAEGDALRFVIGNRPSWASFNSRTGLLSGTPTTANVGTYSNIVIIVSDGTDVAKIGPFSIQVQGPDNHAPTIGGAPASSVQVSQVYSFTPFASDPDGDKLTYAIKNKPTWATFSTSSGRLSGTPSSTHVGRYSNIVISVSDGSESAALSAFSIDVQAAANSKPVISGSPATSVNAGAAYSFQPNATDANGDSLGFTIQNRPSWASFNTSTGRLSGTPTSSHVGTYSDIVISVSDGRDSASLPPFSIKVNASSTATNSPPKISGTPATSVNAGVAYTFQPSASDPNGDKLTFSIVNRPAWATFSTSTGRLSGTPTASQAGTYADIVISVSDGKSSASLPAFSIKVNGPSSGSATLSWVPPTQNEDGTPLTNLAGFRIRYGPSSSSLNQQIELPNPGLSSYVLTGLGSGTWYFAVKAYTTAGVESDLSNVASKNIP